MSATEQWDYLAQKYFTDQASQWVTTILQTNNGWDISDAAVWADEVRYHRPYSAGWHYIGLELNSFLKLSNLTGFRCERQPLPTLVESPSSVTEERDV